jgi:uncharacterized protein YeaO (DUF488 family)
VAGMSVKVKRVYDPPSSQDGYRVLVDRLWPRGLTKEAAHVDLWMRDIAPSTELRKWYAHDVAKWPEFRERYAKELGGHGELLDLLRDLEDHHDSVTLLYGSRHGVHNQAEVILDLLRGQFAHSHQ